MRNDSRSVNTGLARSCADCVIGLIMSIWRAVRPTIFSAWWANRKVQSKSAHQIDSEQQAWHGKLQGYPPDHRFFAVSTLFSIYESDQNRIRGLESKARGVLQSAALALATNAAALNLALRAETRYTWWAIGFSIGSGVYLTAAVVATLQVEKPSPRHVLFPQDTLPAEHTGATLATATDLNQTSSIAKANLTVSAIFDVARALLAAAAALVASVLPI